MIVYLDNAATTPVRSEAVTAAVTAMTQGWGNPSSRHQLGSETAIQVKNWRDEIASGLGCLAEEVYFTSCGTEGDNWAIAGAIHVNRRLGKHIITTAIEHEGVLGPLRELETQGYEVTYLQPERDGTIAPHAVRDALRPDTILVSMMLVNNEVGSILPVQQVAKDLRAAGSKALLHCDAVQGFLKVPFTAERLGADLIAVSGHKIHAPKGIGALYIKKGLRFPPSLRGGGQENGLRAGTEPTSQIAAFAAAVKAGKATMTEDLTHMATMRDYTIERLQQELPQVIVLTQDGAPHILAISLPAYKSEVVVRFLSDRGVCISSGSACHRGKPSHVFAALKLDKKIQDGLLRISFSYDTKKEDVDALVDGIAVARDTLFTSMS